MESETTLQARRFNSRLGLNLFVVYSLIYAGFVGISTFATEWMERPVFAGLNLAVVYGMVLIVLAFVMAIVYGVLCRSEDHSEDSTDPKAQA